MNIHKEDFPENGYELNTREKKIFRYLDLGEFLKGFEIRKEDNYYYTSYMNCYNQFDGFNELKDYLLCRYYLSEQEDGKLLNLLKVTDLDPSFDNNYLIRLTSKKGHTEIVKFLLQDPRVDPSDDKNYSIKFSSIAGHVEIIKLLLQDPRVDPSDQNNYAISWASYNGHTEVVKILLEDPRVDPSDEDNYPIRYASLNGHTEVVKLLLQDSRVDPSDRNDYAIRMASLNEHIEVVKLLLYDKRVNINIYINEEGKFTISSEGKNVFFDTLENHVHNLVLNSEKSPTLKEVKDQIVLDISSSLESVYNKHIEKYYKDAVISREMGS